MSGAVIVKISGRAVDDPLDGAGDGAGGLWGAIAEASRERAVIVVHGGGRRVDRRFAELGFLIERLDGLRVTPEEHLPVVAGVLGVEVNGEIVRAMRDAGAVAVGVGLGAACVCEAVAELGCVGRVVSVDGGVLGAMVGAGLIPVVHSIGVDAAGRPLNVNADDAAAGVAAAVGAERLLLLSDVPGVLGADGALIEALDGTGVDALVGDGVIADGMVPKVRAAMAASALAGCGAVIGSLAEAAALLRGDAGVGTVIGAPAAAGSGA